MTASTFASALADRLLATLPVDQPLDQPTLAMLPPPVAHYLSRWLAQHVGQVGQTLVSPWVQEAEEVVQVRQVLVEVLQRHAQVPPERRTQLVRYAVARVVSHLVRPADTLAQAVEETGAGPYTADVIQDRMSWFTSHAALTEVVASYFEWKGTDALSTDDLRRLVRKIDRRLAQEETLDEWMAHLAPLFDLAALLSGDERRVPAALVRAHLDARDLASAALLGMDGDRALSEAELLALMQTDAPSIPTSIEIEDDDPGYNVLPSSAQAAPQTLPTDNVPPYVPEETEGPPEAEAEPTTTAWATPEAEAENTETDALLADDAHAAGEYGEDEAYGEEEHDVSVADESVAESAGLLAGSEPLDDPELLDDSEHSVSHETEEDTPEYEPVPEPEAAYGSEAYEPAAYESESQELEPQEPEPTRQDEQPTDWRTAPISNALDGFESESDVASEASPEDSTAASSAEAEPEVPTVESDTEAGDLSRPTTIEEATRDEQPLWTRYAAPPTPSVNDRFAEPPNEPPAPEDSASEEDVPLWKRFFTGGDSGPSTPPEAAPEASASMSATEEAPLEEVPREETPLGETPLPEPPADTEASDDLDALERRLLGPAAEQRSWFVVQLTGGDEDAYDATLRALGEAASWTEASQIIARDIFRRYRVNIYSAPAIAFTDAVEAHFRSERVQGRE